MKGIVTIDTMSLEEALFRLQDDQCPKTNDLASNSLCDDDGWDFGVDFKAARTLAEEGWALKARPIWDALEIVEHSSRLRIRETFDVSGGAVDIGRFLQNEPECMFNQSLDDFPYVSIFVEIGTPCTTEASAIFYRGAAIVAVMRAIQASGRSVSLTILGSVVSKMSMLSTLFPKSFPIEEDAHRHISWINLVELGEPINPGRIAFWLAHPTALRRCIFRYVEQQTEPLRDAFGFRDGYGYGYCGDCPKEFMPESAVYIPSLSSPSSFDSPEKALRSILPHFQGKGVELHISS
jgi:hypothetical protein